ncbi:MAG: hypothetical protein ACI3YH_07680, partial [Eubacteriales bacterium]
EGSHRPKSHPKRHTEEEEYLFTTQRIEERIFENYLTIKKLRAIIDRNEGVVCATKRSKSTALSERSGLLLITRLMYNGKAIHG